ncbi:hypothetical protein BJ970_007408 [Saccharopolyspora phatthalungensis]|uniref:Peptidase M14 carboxypeptidase A domain-containing protein n=2 Tax=Saccharopolyspora phatthalungensis TaxID=664693 RepID=A0A840QK03_9PSEU|nr:hypothetical protein [Saccharopolyspora phatthalungensis]
MRLNEEWLGRPLSRTRYERYFYRPASAEQVEWTFPLTTDGYVFDKPLPETMAMMRLIDGVKPDVLASLHDCEMGGAYFYLSRPEPSLYPVLTKICAGAGVPMDLGKPEGENDESFAPGIFKFGHPSEAAARGMDLAAEWGTGSSSIHYAQKYGALGIIPEVPMWRNTEFGDRTVASVNSHQARLDAGNSLVQRGELLESVIDQLDAFELLDTPVSRAARSLVPTVATHGRELLAARENADDGPITVGELASLQAFVLKHSKRFGSLLVRAMDIEILAGLAPRGVRDLANGLRVQVQRWGDDVDEGAAWQSVPIDSLVEVQVKAVIAAARTASHCR